MGSDDQSTFAALLRAWRERAGLTQEELAERAALSADAIGLLERGERRRPQRYTVDRLATALALTDVERARFVAVARAAAPQSPVPADANLPTVVTPFFGRDDELATLTDLLAPPGARLVTLTGPGGVGKTRLALAAAARLAPHFPDGAVFVPLAALEDSGLVAATIARVLAIPERLGRDPETLLVAALRGRARLLVLDNYEHLLAAAPLPAALLAACPHLAIVVTSRVPLHLAGERQFPVAPFSVPDDAHLATDLDAAAPPALALFADRARAVAPTFSITDANRAVVAEICRRLDGLPLAIELAAAWAKALPPRALLTRLALRLPLLADGARDLPARHRTLRDAIAWSVALLPHRERALFRRLSVFVGGGTLDAVEAVGTLERAEGGEMLAALAALVDASLVLPPAEEDLPDDEPRYGMLETVREYASGELAASGEMEAVCASHMRFFLDLVERAGEHLVGPDEGRWLARLEAEHPNLRAALRWAIERGDAEAAVRFAAVLWRFWATHGHLGEGRQWLEAILALAGADGEGEPPRVPPLRRAMLLHVAGNLARVQGDYAAATPRYEECLAIRRVHGDEPGMGAVLHNLGIVAHEQGDTITAIRRHEEGLPLVRRAGHTYGVAFNLVSLADALLARGDVARAVACYDEALALYGELGHIWGIAQTQVGLGHARRATGDVEGAAAAFREAATLNMGIGHHQGTAESLEGIAHVAYARGEPVVAAHLFGAAAALRERINAPLPPTRREEYERAMAAVRRTLGETGFTTAWTEGSRAEPEAALAMAAAHQGAADLPGPRGG